jgi:hypothetical protein
LPFSTDVQIESESIIKFIKNVNIRNKNTAIQYQSRLLSFEKFAKKDNSNVDKLIQQLKNKELDPYEVLNEFCIFLLNNNLSGATFKSKIMTVKTFLEYNDIEISPKKI